MNSDANTLRPVCWRKRQRSIKAHWFRCVFFTSISWMISVDMLVISIVERCFRPGLNYSEKVKVLD